MSKKLSDLERRMQGVLMTRVGVYRNSAEAKGLSDLERQIRAALIPHVGVYRNSTEASAYRKVLRVLGKVWREVDTPWIWLGVKDGVEEIFHLAKKRGWLIERPRGAFEIRIDETNKGSRAGVKRKRASRARWREIHRREIGFESQIVRNTGANFTLLYLIVEHRKVRGRWEYRDRVVPGKTIYQAEQLSGSTATGISTLLEIVARGAKTLSAIAREKDDE